MTVHAAAAAALFLAAEASAQVSSSPFSQPSTTSAYLDTIRQRASAASDLRRPGVVTEEDQTPRGYPSVPTIPQIPTGPNPPSYPQYPAYPTPETGLGPSAADLGRTRFGLPETTPIPTSTALPYDPYDPLSGPSLFPAGSQPAPLPGTLQAEQQNFDERYNPLAQFQEAQNLNPYRNQIFQSGASQGRFGRQDERLTQSALNFARGSGRQDNFQFGDLTLRIGFVGGFDYTDNALFLPIDKTEDVIGRIGMQFAAQYPITKNNRFDFKIGVGYERYLLNPELNDIIRSSGLEVSISPGSRLSWEVDIGNVFFTVFDSFSVTQRTEDDFLTEAQDNYARFNNTFGIAADWLVNNATNITVSLNRTDNIALDDEFSRLNTTAHNLLGSVAYSPKQTWTVGVQGALTSDDRDDEVYRDSNTYQIGMFLATPLSPLTQVRLEGGLQHGEFDSVSPALVAGAPVIAAAESGFTEPYYSVSIINRLNRFTTQSISVGRQTGLSNLNNFFTAEYARYSLSWNFTRTAISTSFYYEDQNNSGDITLERIKRKGGGLNVRHQLNRKITLFAGYNYGQSDSQIPPGTDFDDVPIRDPSDPTIIRNVPGTDITQKTFSFDIAYPFTREVDVILGYRRLKTESSNEGGNFTENRGSINFSYNF